MSKRKYLPTLAELIDRLSIIQLKEVFISEHKKEYADEIKDIMYDIDLMLNDENIKLSGKDVRAIIVFNTEYKSISNISNMNIITIKVCLKQY